MECSDEMVDSVEIFRALSRTERRRWEIWTRIPFPLPDRRKPMEFGCAWRSRWFHAGHICETVRVVRKTLNDFGISGWPIGSYPFRWIVNDEGVSGERDESAFFPSTWVDWYERVVATTTRCSCYVSLVHWLTRPIGWWEVDVTWMRIGMVFAKSKHLAVRVRSWDSFGWDTKTMF